MKTKIAGCLIFLVALGAAKIGISSAQAAEGFSREKALEHLRVLVETIGPRPLGSPQEKAALTYFAEKLAEFGYQVEWQPVKGSAEPLGSSALNTASFNVIGKLAGRTPREIIVGAHIDSASPEIPGANDDGSGVAVILELARILAQEPHESTLVFVAFCGEEAGLVGSKSFVEHYPLDNVALMLQLDMASNDSPLLLFIDTKKAQTPAWLVSASVDAFHALGYRNIDYPVFFQSLNNAFGGATSDHKPFLEKGFPAIGFVSDITFPIHTPNDSLDYFEPEGLERSGRLVQELIRRFDPSQPEEKTGRYMLVLIGERPFFIPVAWLEVFIIISLVIGLATLVRLYQTRRLNVNWEEDKKAKKSWPKLLIMNLIIVVVMLCSLWIMQGASGQRTPWYAHPEPYLLYSFLFFILGVWLSLQVTRKWKLRKNSFFYFIRASAYLAALVAAAWLASGPRLALVPAAGLLFLSLACLGPWAWLKGLFWVLASFWILRMLVLSEVDKMIFRTVARAFAEFETFSVTLLFWTGLGLFFLLWTTPFLLGFAAVYRSARGDFWAIKRFRRPIALIPIGILAIGGTGYLRNLPAFDGPWQQEVTITQKLDAKNKTAVEFSSFGYLKAIRAVMDGREEILDERKSFKKIEMPLEMDWLKEQVSLQSEEKEGQTVTHLKIRLDFERPPYSVSLKIKSDRPFSVEGANVNYRHKKNRATIRWAYHPGQSLAPEMDIRLPKGAGLDAEIAATFLEVSVPISCEPKSLHFIQRAHIRREVKLLSGD